MKDVHPIRNDSREADADMTNKTPKTKLVAFKVEEELADFLNKLPNKSAFIRKAIAAQMSTACPLCNGSGQVSRWAHDHTRRCSPAGCRGRARGAATTCPCRATPATCRRRTRRGSNSSSAAARSTATRATRSRRRAATAAGTSPRGRGNPTRSTPTTSSKRQTRHARRRRAWGAPCILLCMDASSLHSLKQACARPLEHPALDDLRDAGRAVIEFLLADFTQLDEHPVGSTASRPALDALLLEPPPERGQRFDAVLEELRERVVKHVYRAHHPRFLAFVPGAPSFASIL